MLFYFLETGCRKIAADCILMFWLACCIGLLHHRRLIFFGDGFAMKHLWFCCAIWILGTPCFGGSNNDFSLHFFDQGFDQKDRVRIQIDDDVTSAVDGSTAADIGSADFTIEFWLRGILADNNAAPRAAGEYADTNWRLGNIIFDRDIWSLTVQRDFGVSLGGGRVEWGNDTGGVDAASHTLVGGVAVLDGQWHHVAVTRDAATGIKRIFVDGFLDAESSAGVSTADLSYPNDGVGDQSLNCTGGPWGPFICIGKDKHDTDWVIGGCGSAPAVYAHPGFQGWVDEVRLWNSALDLTELRNVYFKVIDPVDFPALAAYWRFEEGAGTVIVDSSAGGTNGILFDSVAGNGEWSVEAPDLPGFPLAPPSAAGDWDIYE